MRSGVAILFFTLLIGIVWSSVRAFEGTDRIVCGTNEQNEIWCTSYQGLEHGQWVRLPGSLKQVIVRDGQLWGVNLQGEIYYASDVRNPQWIKIQGRAKEITEGHGVLCTVNDVDEIWCADKGINTPQPAWHMAPRRDRLKFISVN